MRVIGKLICCLVCCVLILVCWFAVTWIGENSDGCIIKYESIRFDATMYEEPKFPKEITFQIDDQGRIFTRIQTQPNIYGQSTPGKIFFPDKSWTGAIFAGNAICRIVKEFDNYGFITGHICPYPSVSLDELLDYLWEHKIYRDDEDRKSVV